MENEKETQLSETFIKTQVEKARQKYKEYHASNPNADKESLFTIGYCIGGFDSVVFIMNTLYGLLRRAMVESEIRHLKAVLIKNL